MMLCDTSVIVAVINPADANHVRCLTAIEVVQDPLVTTWPCMTEAMYLVGIAGQEKLRRLIEARVFDLFESSFESALRSCELMRKYADAPMDFADASLVVAAEVRKINRILTLDKHFYAYRIRGTDMFEVFP